jgi:hypothetical protein
MKAPVFPMMAVLPDVSAIALTPHRHFGLSLASAEHRRLK